MPGGIVAAEKVTALNTGTGVKSEMSSNAAGQYTAANLPVGTYDIVFDAAGFKKAYGIPGGERVGDSPGSG